MTADQLLHHLPPRLPGLMPCSFFLWGYVKGLCLSIASTRSAWTVKMNHRCYLRNWSWHAAVGLGRNGLSTWHLPSRKGRTHRALTSFKKHWRVSLSISRLHLTILSAIQVYLFYEMCQGLVKKSVYCVTLNMSKTVIFKISNGYFLCIKNYKHGNYWNSEGI